MDLLNFSSANGNGNGNGHTPARPQKIEQLFSPSTFKIRTPTSHLTRCDTTTRVNDVTYQVPIKTNSDRLLLPPPPNLPVIDNYGDIGLPTPASANYFPRCSTGLKGPCPPPAMVAALANESASSNILLDSGSISSSECLETEQSTQYKPIHQIKDAQPIRATCFHPLGDVYVVGSNSRKLRICYYPSDDGLRHFTKEHDNDQYYPREPEYAFQFLQLHQSSIYCATFNDSGTLLATGSNDQTVHVIQYDSEKHMPKSHEFKLSHHTGTVRDVMFMSSSEPGSGKRGSFNNSDQSTNLLVSAGAGENEIIITDCNKMKPVRTLKGHHEAPIMSLHKWNDKNCFVSGSLDGTIKFWDVRSNLCCSTVKSTISDSQPGLGHSSRTPVGVVRVESNGKLLVSGFKDGQCMLYDIRGGKILQLFKAHEDEIRSINFSPKSYYLLTAGYDRKIKLMDLQGELSRRLPCVELGELADKVVQTAWHPTDYSFVATGADGTATLWAMPDIITNSNSYL